MKNLEFYGTLIIGILSGSIATYLTMANHEQLINFVYALAALILGVICIIIGGMLLNYYLTWYWKNYSIK